VIAVTALVAACSQSVGGQAEPSGSPQSAPPNSAPTTATAPPLAPGVSRPPGQGASIEEVIAWIEAGTPADPGSYHEVFSDGQTTRLGDDIAFTAPSGAPNDTTQCLTDATYNDGALACLVELDSPAPRPSAAEGVWKAGWIDYSGTGLQIGSLHGDPGPFIKGVGPALSGRIIDARKQGGDFKNWDDFMARVKGMKAKSAAKLSAEGLTVNGESFKGARKAATKKRETRSAKAAAAG